MSIFNWFRPKARLDDSEALRRAIAAAGGCTASGARVSAASALRVAAAFRCVQIISDAVAVMPVSVKRRVDDRTREDASGHPVSRLLRRRPNAWMTPGGFRKLMTVNVLLAGNAFALIVRSGGRVTDLLPLDPARMRIEEAPTGGPLYTYQLKSGAPRVFPKREVLHLMGPSLDGMSGLSIIGHARESIGLALQTERHGAVLFENGTRLGGILKHDKSLSPEAIERLRAGLEEYRGAGNAHKNLILEEGMSFAPVAMSQEDAQYIETRRFTRSEIAMFFGVPPHMIGDTEKSTSWGSGIEQQGAGFVAYTLQPYLTLWEETAARDLIDEDDIFVRHNPAGLVRGDIKARFAAYKTAREMGVYSANDIRAKEDENPIPGGDVYLVPLNMTATDKSEADESKVEENAPKEE